MKLIVSQEVFMKLIVEQYVCNYVRALQTKKNELLIYQCRLISGQLILSFSNYKN